VEKVAILYPCHGRPTFDFLMSVSALLIRSSPFYTMRPFGAESSNLPGNRNTLAGMALGWEADWLLWFDLDHAFPSAAFERLRAHGKDAVGVTQPIRGGEGEIIPSATGLDGERVWPKRGKGLEEVSNAGLAITLIRAEAMRKVKFPFFASGNEDMFFSKRLRESGTRMYIDHELSMDSGHTAETILRFPEAE
jgi:hypothetical protein